MKQPHNTKAQGAAVFNLVSGIVILLAVIFFFIKLAGSGSYSDVAATTKSATQTRIQPTGQLTLGDGTEPGSRTGQQIFEKICISCHSANSVVPNVPRFENKADWAPRIAQGLDVLFEHASKGFNAMPARGGAADLTDEELKRAIVYMANSAGGTFAEPSADAAAPAGDAASGATPAASAAAPAAPAAPAADAAKADDKAAAPAAEAPKAGGADGKKVYEATCAACHGNAIPGIPHVGTKADWEPRIKKGKDALYKSALGGFNAMPAKGGNTSLSDDEVKAAVDYMVKQSGGK